MDKQELERIQKTRPQEKITYDHGGFRPGAGRPKHPHEKRHVVTYPTAKDHEFMLAHYDASERTFALCALWPVFEKEVKPLIEEHGIENIDAAEIAKRLKKQLNGV